ncbi:MAG: tRNA dihydrouridine synthase DusB [Clostridiales bacterium]|nr:tRNA dihydrouridine synthase DusB [Clostridiales bacterium]
MRDLKIGNVKLENPFILAPLAGVTDSVMRDICTSFGAALTVTEMVSAKGLFYGDKGGDRLLYMSDNAGPTSIQIFGSEPDIIAYAAQKLDGLNNVILDINMGCPVPKVVKNGDGSALLQDPELVYKVVASAVSNTSKPVTVKIRKGFKLEENNAVEIAKAAEAAGASAVAVHGRTREQYYTGKADWNVITDVKNSLNIPVIGNGDVMSAEDGIRMLEETGCDFVMVARGALGNPWIFSELNALYAGEGKTLPPTEQDKIKMILRHLDGLIELKGERIAVNEMRKHIGWYTKGMRGAAKLRQTINYLETANEIREVLKREE